MLSLRIISLFLKWDLTRIPPNLKVIAAELLRLKCGGATWRCPPLPPLLWLLKHLKAKVGRSVNTSGLWNTFPSLYPGV